MAEGKPHPERDRQPSARYVERLAEAVADRVLTELFDFQLLACEPTSPRARRVVEWAVIDAAKQQRADNELYERYPALPREVGRRGSSEGTEEAPLDAPVGTD